VTKTYKRFVIPNFKPDLAIKDVVVQDRFGNVVTAPKDAQPYKMCVSFWELGMNRYGHCLCPQSTFLGISYLSPTGTGTSVGHDSDLAVSFAGSYPAGWRFKESDDSKWWYEPPTCIDMPGLPQAGAYVDVKLKIDSKNTTDETNEGNNAKNLRITRQ
jgi:hypothetical protein